MKDKKRLKEAILGIEVTQFDGQKADLEELVNPKQLEKIIDGWMSEVLSQELPVIPKFVADFIEETKKQYKTLVFAITHIYDENEIGKYPNKEEKRIFQWMELDDNEEVFARAWLDGYTVEEEPLYYIVGKNDEVLWFRNHEGVPQLSGSTLRSVLKSNSKDRYQFTEQEIKDYDERFLAFKVPVEEVAE